MAKWYGTEIAVSATRQAVQIHGGNGVTKEFIVERLAREGQLKAHCHTGFWQCMDTQREQQQLESLWVSGDAPWKIW